MKDNTQIKKDQEKESTNLKMELSIMENGKMTIFQEKEPLHQLDMNIQEIGKMERDQEKENTHIQIKLLSIMEIGKITKELAMES